MGGFQPPLLMESSGCFVSTLGAPPGGSGFEKEVAGAKWPLSPAKGLSGVDGATWPVRDQGPGSEQ